MASHDRRSRRGSLSILSFDIIKSLSRAGSRREVISLPDKSEPPVRSQSSLSYTCDPRRQLSPEPVGNIQVSSVSKATSRPLPIASGFLPQLKNDGNSKENKDLDKRAASTATLDHESKRSRSRHLSWLSISRPQGNRVYVRSRSVQLPKDTSFSTVARSVISAPVLTSTTNTNVARVEGVRCVDSSTPNFDLSAWVSQPISDPARPQSLETASIVAVTNSLTSKIDAAVRDVRESEGKGKTGRDETSRKEKLFRLPGSFANRIRGPWSTSKSDSDLSREHFSYLMDGRKVSPTVEERIAHRKAEAINLCKEKIRSLTGHGNVKRKGVQDDKDLMRSFKAKYQDQRLLDDVETDLGKCEQSDGGSDFANGSFTRSFASAVDKLDFQSTLKSRKGSFLRLKASLSDTKQTVTEMDDKSNLTLDYRESMLPGLYPKQEPTLQPQQPGKERPIYGTKTESCTFSVEQSGLVSRPELSSNHPGGVNPLGCHPDVMLFSEPLIGTSDDPTPFKANPSPTAQGLAPANLHEKARTLQCNTPTRPPGNSKGIDGLDKSDISILKKSRSGFRLFQKSRNEKNIAADTKEERLRNSQAIAKSSSSPLKDRDENQRMDGSKEKLKKSKSMTFGIFGARNSPSTDCTTIPPMPVAYQPTTPSPLRHGRTAKYPEAKYSSGKPKLNNAGAGTPVRPTRPPTYRSPSGNDEDKDLESQEWI